MTPDRVPHTFGNLVRGLLQPQVRRTCRHCGGTWLVPRYYARSHAHGSPAASGVGVTRQGVEMINDVVADRAAQEQTWRAFQICPHCQTVRSYTDRRMWFASGRPNLD